MLFRSLVPGGARRRVERLDADILASRRLDRLFVRLFEEDEDLSVYLLVDASASMGTGTPPKLDRAAEMGADVLGGHRGDDQPGTGDEARRSGERTHRRGAFAARGARPRGTCCTGTGPISGCRTPSTCSTGGARG